MECDNISSTGEYVVSNLFKQFFSSVYNSDHSFNINNCFLNNNNCSYKTQLANINISVGEIFQILSSLDLNPCPGLDGILNILLHSFKHTLAVPIHKLFSHSLHKGVFPPQWKNSFITPIH